MKRRPKHFRCQIAGCVAPLYEFVEVEMHHLVYSDDTARTAASVGGEKERTKTYQNWLGVAILRPLIAGGIECVEGKILESMLIFRASFTHIVKKVIHNSEQMEEGRKEGGGELVRLSIQLTALYLHLFTGHVKRTFSKKYNAS